MTQRTATTPTAATQQPFNADLREFGRPAGAGKFPLRLADFADTIDVGRRSKQNLVRAHDRAIGVLIGIALTGAAWAAWAIVATQ